MTDESGWQARTIARLLALGLNGFVFEAGRWSPIDSKSWIVGGPFATMEEFDAWLDDRERQ